MFKHIDGPGDILNGVSWRGDAFDVGIDGANFARIDASQSVLLYKDLIKKLAKTVTDPVLKLNGFDLIPAFSHNNPGLAGFEWEVETGSAAWAPVSDKTNRLPVGEVGTKERDSKIRCFGGAMTFGWKELREAAYAGKPLQQRKLNKLRRGYDVLVNRTMWYGDNDLKLQGLRNHRDLNVVTKKAITIADMTAAELEDLLLAECSAITEATEEGFIPSTTLVSIAFRNQLVKKRADAAGSGNTDSIFRVIQDKLRELTGNPEYRIIAVREMANFFGAGTDGLITYVKDPDVLEYQIGFEYTPLDIQRVAFRIEVPAICGLGELHLYRPEAVRACKVQVA